MHNIGFSGHDVSYLNQFLLKITYKFIGLIRDQDSSLNKLEHIDIFREPKKAQKYRDELTI